jgi:predicted CoA-binding protein
MQLGIANEAAARKAQAAGLTVVMDACMLVEHKKRKQKLS